MKHIYEEADGCAFIREGALTKLTYSFTKRHTMLLPSSQFWPIPSMSRRVINCAKLCLSHPFSRIKWIRQWAVDRDPVLPSTTSAKIGKTAILLR